MGIQFGIYNYPLVMTNSLLLKMTIEIMDSPINSMVIFHSYVKLPESIPILVVGMIKFPTEWKNKET